MKRFSTIAICLLLTYTIVCAQERVIDATDYSPVAAASIFDATGNMVGVTLNDGCITEIPKTAYPITIRSIGYEQLVIEQQEDKAWPMTPIAYELEEFVVVPVERNILKQTFYVREYFSMTTVDDTITIFFEHMANRFLPASEDAKFSGSSSLRVLKSRCFSRYKVAEEDSFAINSKPIFPPMVTIHRVSTKEVTAPESFKDPDNTNKLYEEPGKSGIALIQKQNAHTFITIRDILAETKEHDISFWPLKIFGLTIKAKQLYNTHTYCINDNGIYQPKDLIEAGSVMEADGGGKLLRKLFKSEEPILIRSRIEVYTTDREYLTKNEAKKEYKNKPDNVEFEIPTTVPPLTDAIKQLVERATAEKRKL